MKKPPEGNRPIKTLGLHEVKVRLHAEVAATVTMNTVKRRASNGATFGDRGAADRAGGELPTAVVMARTSRTAGEARDRDLAGLTELEVRLRLAEALITHGGGGARETAGELLRDAAQGADVGRDVLAGAAVAARRRADEPPVPVDQRHREAVAKLLEFGVEDQTAWQVGEARAMKLRRLRTMLARVCGGQRKLAASSSLSRCCARRSWSMTMVLRFLSSSTARKELCSHFFPRCFGGRRAGSRWSAPSAAARRNWPAL